MEILTAFIVLVIGVLAEASIGIEWNIRGIGTLLAVCIMGAVILWAVRHPKK